MIFLVGGVAKSGKTWLAKRLMGIRNCGYFSTDYLMMALFRGMPKGPVQPDEPDALVSKAMAPFLEGLLETLVSNRTEYILEGVHITPEIVSRWHLRFPGQIRCVFLGYKDQTISQKRMELNRFRPNIDNDWLGQLPPSRQEEIIGEMIQDSEILFQKASKFYFPYVEVAQIELQSEEIIQKLTE